MKVVVAMSGGVDSSVAAYLLKKQGYEVFGLSLELWEQRGRKNFKTCCSVEAIEGARKVAEGIGIPHYSVDVKDSFMQYVIEPFCEDYLSGKTPNPCILCNKHIKFNFLLSKARELGADLIATGHYAGVIQKDGRFYLKKGLDPKKDQSYVLYVMNQEQLSRTIFPLAGLFKEDTRRIASAAGIITAERPESQEICFVGDGRYGEFIKGLNPEASTSGPIVNIDGKVIGEHRGIAFYTIGQRAGLGSIRPAGKPLYVIRFDKPNRAVIVGERETAMKRSFSVKDLNWPSKEPLSYESQRPEYPFRASVKIRSAMKEEPATITPINGSRVSVEFDTPQWAPAPGQSAVFYDGDIVLGGGIIEEF
ncbi:MAG: tRNA 2-thiouridine(34) synthase MnmA [Nitrospirae bacterium]|nr:tRNA 2-thiouridine(34) synthase MnmA [Nitrospirota bacterium]